jgi:hypothetical protein
MKPDPKVLKKQTYSSLFMHNYDYEIAARKKLMVRSYISDFLNTNNINYLVTDFMPDSEEQLQSVSESYPIAYEKIYTDKYRLKNLCEISIKYTKLPCGHDGVEAQLEIGNYVYDELVARYNEPIVKLQDYTTLKEHLAHYITGGLDKGFRTEGFRTDWL